MRSASKQNGIIGCRTELLLWVAAFAVIFEISYGTTEEKIRSLLADAAAATTPDQAQQKLDQAAALLPDHVPNEEMLKWGFLQADIFQTGGRIYTVFYRRHPESSALARKASQQFQQAYQIYEQLQKQAEDHADRLERLETYPRQVEKRQAYQKLIGNSARADYGIAWTDYYWAQIMPDGDDRRELIKRAIEKFMIFTANGYRPNPIVSSSFWGQALCYYDLKQYFDVTQLLDLNVITPDQTDPTIYKQIVLVRIRACRAMGSDLQAENSAALFFNTLDANHVPDTLELQIAMERVRSLLALTRQGDKNPFIAGHRQRLEQVCKLVYDAGQPWPSKLAEVLGPSSGLGQLIQAKQEFKQGRYEQVISLADAAGRSGDEAEAYLLVDWQYLKIVTCWKLQRWHEVFESGRAFLKKHGNDRRATEVCRYVAQAGIHSLRTDDAVAPDDVMKTIDWIEKTYPDSAQRPWLLWYRAWLFLDQDQPGKALALLKPVQPGSVIYLHALYGRCLACSQQFIAIHGDNSKQSEILSLLDEMDKAIGQFIEAVAKPPDEEQKKLALQISKMTMDTVGVLLDHTDRDAADAMTKKAIDLIGHAESIQSIAGAYDESRFTAVRLEANLISGRLEKVCKAIDEMPESFFTTGITSSNGQNSAAASDDSVWTRFFVMASNRLESRYQQSASSGSEKNSAEDLKKQAQRLVRIQHFLLKHTGSDALARDREIAIRRRLADNLVRVGQDRQAADQYRWLIDRIPHDQSGAVIRGLALALERSGQYEPALESWRTLAKSLPQGSDSWLEAHYHRIECYRRLGQLDQARTLLDYFRLLCPQIKSSLWRQRFEALEHNINQPAVSTGSTGEGGLKK